MIVCQFYDKKNSQRKNIKRGTEKGRQYLMNALENDTEPKVILTPEQEERLLAFMETDNIYSKYYHMMNAVIRADGSPS